VRAKGSVIWFGKHQGRRWSEVAIEDPAYLDWVIVTMGGDARDLAMQALERAATVLLAAAARSEAEASVQTI